MNNAATISWLYAVSQSVYCNHSRKFINPDLSRISAEMEKAELVPGLSVKHTTYARFCPYTHTEQVSHIWEVTDEENPAVHILTVDPTGRPVWRNRTFYPQF